MNCLGENFAGESSKRDASAGLRNVEPCDHAATPIPNRGRRRNGELRLDKRIAALTLPKGAAALRRNRLGTSRICSLPSKIGCPRNHHCPGVSDSCEVSRYAPAKYGAIASQTEAVAVAVASPPEEGLP